MVNIDTVYQNVLALANKEQRGYITPQEFNLFANQAQMEIFEQYFYDINQFSKQPGNSTEYSDMLRNLQEKIDLFQSWKQNVTVANQWGSIILDQVIPDLYRLGRVSVQYQGYPDVTAEYRTWMENTTYGISPLTKGTKKRPVYNRIIGQSTTNPPLGRNTIKIRPYPIPGTDVVRIYYTKIPARPKWSYNVVAGKALLNATGTINFELHSSEESELIYRILALAGIAIQKPQLTQIAVGLEGAKQQQEK